MNHSIISSQCHPETGVPTERYTSAASLAILGLTLQERKLWEPIAQQVQIPQKTVKYRPSDKLYDAFIALLAGAHGIVQINTLLRSDRALQAAFGREGCAEQSVVQDTLDACGAQQVEQLRRACAQVFAAHSQVSRHQVSEGFLLLDVDLTGLPCGAKAEFATRGYFAGQRNRRGRQLGRVLASATQEIVTDLLFAGHEQLNVGLQPLMEAAEQVLQLDEPARRETLVRIDAGAGTQVNFHWLAQRGYRFVGKVYSGKYAQMVARTVKLWYADPLIPGREYALVSQPLAEYPSDWTCLAVRYRQRNGQWKVGLLLSNLTAEQILTLMQRPLEEQASEAALIAAYLRCYDQRGGHIESSFCGDKSGLGLLKRSKKRFAAQEMLLLLNMLVHNVILWARTWLQQAEEQGEEEGQLALIPSVQHYGMLRMVRDVFHISGKILFDPPLCATRATEDYPLYHLQRSTPAATLFHRRTKPGDRVEPSRASQVVQIVLNEQARLGVVLLLPFQRLLAQSHIAVTLGEI